MQDSRKNTKERISGASIMRRLTALALALFMTVTAIPMDAYAQNPVRTPKGAIPTDFNAQGFKVSYSDRISRGGGKYSYVVENIDSSVEGILNGCIHVTYTDPVNGSVTLIDNINIDWTDEETGESTAGDWSDENSPARGVITKSGYTGSLFAEIYLVKPLADTVKIKYGGRVLHDGDTINYTVPFDNLTLKDRVGNLNEFFSVASGMSSIPYTDTSVDEEIYTGYYTIISTDKDPGQAAITLQFGANYANQTFTVYYTIGARNILNATIADIEALTYNGNAQEPALAVTDSIPVAGTQLVKGKDYTVAFTDNTNAGTATATLTGINNYTGTITKTFTIQPKAIDAGFTVTGIDANYPYTGSKITPIPVVKDGTTTLTKDVDYTLTYGDNTGVGPGTVTITGKGNYGGSRTENFTIGKGKLNDIDVTFTCNGTTWPSQTGANVTIETGTDMGLVYNGSAHTPPIVVKKGTKTLTADTHYELTWTNNTAAGTATATITGKGWYEGTVKLTATISKKSIASPDVVIRKGGVGSTGTVTNPEYTQGTGITTGGAVEIHVLLKKANGYYDELTEGVDYTKTAAQNTVGAQVITIYGKGNYDANTTQTVTVSRGVNVADYTQFQMRNPVYANDESKKVDNNGAINYWPGDKNNLLYVFDMAKPGGSQKIESNNADFEVTYSTDGTTYSASPNVEPVTTVYVKVSAKQTSANYYGEKILKYTVNKRNLRTSFMKVSLATDDSASIKKSEGQGDFTTHIVIPNTGSDINDLGSALRVFIKKDDSDDNDSIVDTLTYGTDYRLSSTTFKQTENSKQITIKSVEGGKFYGDVSLTLEWGKKSLSHGDISFQYTDPHTGTPLAKNALPEVLYDGDEHKLWSNIKLYDGDDELVEDTHYTIIPSSSKTVATEYDYRSVGATITITYTAKPGTNYDGTKTIRYTITRASQTTGYKLIINGEENTTSVEYKGDATWTDTTFELVKGDTNVPEAQYHVYVQDDHNNEITNKTTHAAARENMKVTPGETITFEVVSDRFQGAITKQIKIDPVELTNDTAGANKIYRFGDGVQMFEGKIGTGTLPATLTGGIVKVNTPGQTYNGLQIKLDQFKIYDTKGQAIDARITPNEVVTPGTKTLTITGKGIKIPPSGTAPTVVLDVTSDISGLTWNNNSTTITLPYKNAEYKIGTGDLKIVDGAVELPSDAYSITLKKGSANATQIKEVGQYTVKCTPKAAGGYTGGEVSLTVKVLYDLSEASIKMTGLDNKTILYKNGAEAKPAISVSIRGADLTLGMDYTLVLEDSAGNATPSAPGEVVVTVNEVADHSYNGPITDSYTIVKLPFNDDNVEITVPQNLTYEPDWTTWEADLRNRTTGIKVYYKNGQQLQQLEADKYEVQFTAVDVVNGVPQAGVYDVTVVVYETDTTKEGTIKGTAATSLTIGPKELTGATAELTAPGSLMYTGNELKPTTIKDKGYDITSSVKINSGAVGPTSTTVVTEAVIEGNYNPTTKKGNYDGTARVSFTINKLNLGSAEVTAEVERPSYTGRAISIKPTISLYTENGTNKIDPDLYQLNVTSATDVGEVNSVTITPDPGYLEIVQGTKTIAWSIAAKPITDADVIVDIPENCEYTGTPITFTKTQISIYVGNRSNRLNSDNFTIGAYENNTNSGANASVTITGTKNLTGSVKKTFSIGTDIASRDVKELSAVVKQFDGKADLPGADAFYQKLQKGNYYLVYNTDYTVEPPTYVNVSDENYKLKITGKGGFYGTRELTYRITKQDVADAYISLAKHSFYYSGLSIVPEFDVFVRKAGATEYTALNVADYNAPEPADSTKVGTKTLTVTLTNYVAQKYGVPTTLKETYTINPVDMSYEKLTFKFRESNADTYTADYTGKDITPRVIISGQNPDGVNMFPSEGTDYTLSYKNNKTAGKAAAVATGKGNFTGSKEMEFIIMGDFSATTTQITIPKQMYTGAAISSLTGVTVVVGGNTLTTSQYKLSDFSSSDDYEKTGRVTFEPVDTTYYKNKKTVTFYIDASGDMYSVRGVANAYTYSGQPIKPIALITDANGQGVNYDTTKVTYKNTSDASACVKPGMVTMTIPLTAGTASTTKAAGRDAKGAVITANKEIKYQILQKNINACAIGTAADVAYDGKAKTPEISIINGNMTLGTPDDFTITYQNNIYPGRARIKLTGRGNYTGSADVYFSITMPDVKNLKAEATATNKISVSWKKSTGTFTGYRLSYRAGSGTQKQVTVGKNKLKKTLSKLTAGKTYTIIVQTYYKAANGRVGYGNASVVTQDTKPSKAQNVKAKALSGRKIKVTWNKVAGASGYMIYRKAGNGKYKRIKTFTSGSTVSFTNTGLTKNVKYTYRVLAYRLNGTKRTYSAYSDPASAKAKK